MCGNMMSAVVHPSNNSLVGASWTVNWSFAHVVSSESQSVTVPGPPAGITDVMKKVALTPFQSRMSSRREVYLEPGQQNPGLIV